MHCHNCGCPLDGPEMVGTFAHFGIVKFCDNCVKFTVVKDRATSFDSESPTKSGDMA